MIYTKEAAFIHVPKTGGMSVTRFLVNALDCPVTAIAPANAREHARNMANTAPAAAKLAFVEGDRHETCPQAVALIKAQGWEIPPVAFAMIRHPADLMLSFYRHMRKPVVWKLRGMTADTLTGLPKLAMELSFDAFCRATPFYGMSDDALMQYYQPSGFDHLDIVPLQEISAYLNWRFGDHHAFDPGLLEHKNRSTEPVPETPHSAQTRAYIEEMYPQVNRLYQATLGTGTWCRETSGAV